MRSKHALICGRAANRCVAVITIRHAFARIGCQSELCAGLGQHGVQVASPAIPSLLHVPYHRLEAPADQLKQPQPGPRPLQPGLNRMRRARRWRMAARRGRSAATGRRGLQHAQVRHATRMDSGGSCVWQVPATGRKLQARAWGSSSHAQGGECVGQAMAVCCSKPAVTDASGPHRRGSRAIRVSSVRPVARTESDSDKVGYLVGPNVNRAVPGQACRPAPYTVRRS
jgi:hypothetical protein